MSIIEIHIKGNIDPNLSDWFQGMVVEAISLDESRISCEAADNSTIYGILSALNTLGLSLISVSVTGNDGVRFIPLSSNLE
ncbi:MAG TPA: hypothetical protein VF498_16045 [Anaerolineales bacterium]